MPGAPDGRERIAVVGLGGVGGVLAARTGALGVATARTAAVVRDRGLRLEHRGHTSLHRLQVVESLERPVGLLVVAVKAYALDDALERIPGHALDGAVVLPLLNGIEHVGRLRERLAPVGATVLAGSIGRFQAHAPEPGVVVQLSEGALVTAASDALGRGEVEHALAPLAVPGVEVEVGSSEAAVLWDKAVRLAVLAAAAIASGEGVGALRSDGAWRGRIRTALAEAARVAAAHGATVDPEAHWAFIEGLDPDLMPSAGRDALQGHPTELDAITGSVVRAARVAGIPTPELESLLADASARA